MFIGITISDADLNSAMEGAKVGDALEISATVTEINGKRIMADATDAEIQGATEAEDEDGEAEAKPEESGMGMEGGDGMHKKGGPPKAIIMFGLRK